MAFQHFKQPVVDYDTIEEDKGGEKKDAKAGKERGGRSMRRIDLFCPYCHEVRWGLRPTSKLFSLTLKKNHID